MLERDGNAAAGHHRESVQGSLVHSPVFQAFCRPMRFAPGDVLRRKGLHYRDMYLTIDGSFEVDFGPGLSKPLISKPGSPIGEMGFLSGSPATATVTARTDAGALLLDDQSLARLEREQPGHASELLRQLAQIAEERTSYNLLSTSTEASAYAKAPAIDVYLCRTKEMLEGAKRLRYEVYCIELGRQSPYADHDRKIITDELDAFGNTFVAVENGEIIGTMRSNLAVDGPLGILEDLYGMKASGHHPHATGICTKFIVMESKRGSPAALRLIAAVVRYGLNRNVKECYIDCIPALLPYYKAMGFRVSGESFLHRENGPSVPMMLDLAKCGSRLSREFSVLSYLSIYARAQLIKFTDQWWGR